MEPVPRRAPRGLAQWLALAAALAVLLLVCAAPLLAIVWRALLAGPAAWAELLAPDTLAALWNTLRFSALALLLATLLGLAHTLSARSGLLWRTASYLPFVVSPVTVAFGLLLLYPGWTASLSLLLAAYALLAFPFVTQSLIASVIASLSVCWPAVTPRTSAPMSRMRNTLSDCRSMSCAPM